MIGGGALKSLLIGLSAAAPTAAPPALPPPPVSIWEMSGGSATHQQTGLVCPPTINGRKRYAVMAFDLGGRDVSCGYNADNAAWAVTAYLTQSGDDLEAPMARAKDELTTVWVNRNPRPLQENRAVQEGGMTWWVAAYAFDHDTRSEIWLTAVRGWVLKLRTTYASADAEVVAQTRAALIQQIARSAGERFTLCSQGSPTRTGVAMTGAERQKAANAAATQLAMEGFVEDVAVGYDLKRKVALSPLQNVAAYCLEDTFRVDGGGFQSWRGVDAKGQDAGVDRISGLTTGRPLRMAFRLQSLPETSSPTPARWLAVMRRPNGAHIYEVYDGRPAARDAARLLMRALETPQPLSGYILDGSKVTINTTPVK